MKAMNWRRDPLVLKVESITSRTGDARETNLAQLVSIVNLGRLFPLPCDLWLSTDECEKVGEQANKPPFDLPPSPATKYLALALGWRVPRG